MNNKAGLSTGTKGSIRDVTAKYPKSYRHKVQLICGKQFNRHWI